MHETLMAETRMCIHALTPPYAVGSLRVAEHRRIAKSFTKGDPGLTDQLLAQHMEDGIVRLGAVGASHETGELSS